MFLVGLSIFSNISYAKEDVPSSFELLELLGQFNQQDESWVNNELRLDNELQPDVESDIKNKMNNKIQKSDKIKLGESINE